ncbi:MAG TPA: MarR family transcriptional regulator [Anaerolineae bacterium]|jgi:DNA-binding MarR family transcriptional regulator
MINDALFTETMHRFLTVYRYMRQYGRQLQTQGLSGREVSILRYLLDSGPLTIGQCRDYLFINDSSTSELISHLETEGYVSRVRSLTDNRSVLVSLTALGRKTARTLSLGGIPLLRERLRAMPVEQLARIDAALGDIVGLLEIENEHV